MNHRVGKILFAMVVGIAVATLSFRWITNPEPRAERALQENVVEVARQVIKSVVMDFTIEIVDPLSPNRKVGKVYVYRKGEKSDKGGWDVSGYYRRDENDRWHPFLIVLSDELQLEHLKVGDEDQELIDRAENDPTLEVRF